MDGCLIIEFKSQSEAKLALSVIDQIAESWWQSQGYTVIDGELIGKNAATGSDMPDSAKTTTWDEVKYSPAKTWYITSPASSPNFKDWRSYIPEGVTIPEDIVLPAEWAPKEE